MSFAVGFAVIAGLCFHSRSLVPSIPLLGGSASRLATIFFSDRFAFCFFLLANPGRIPQRLGRRRGCCRFGRHDLLLMMDGTRRLLQSLRTLQSGCMIGYSHGALSLPGQQVQPLQRCHTTREKSRSKSFNLARRRVIAFVCNWQIRLSVTERTLPISLKVMSS